MDEDVATVTSDSPLPVPTSPGDLGLKVLSQIDQKEERENSNREEENDQCGPTDSNNVIEGVEQAKSEKRRAEDGEEGGLEFGLESGVSEEHVCRFCGEKFKQPRILSCLHVFCTPCLEEQLKEGSVEHDTLVEGEGKKRDRLKCTVCKQITPLTRMGVDDLPVDTVMSNILDLSAIDDPQIVCTSCKAREKAVARCNDCVGFLCPNCVTAHMYMRCFENHQVE